MLNDYKYLKTKEIKGEVFELENIQKGKYSKILSNLLSIKPRSDVAVFTKVDNKTNFDLFNLLEKEEDIKKIYNQANFKIKIQRSKISDIKKILSNLTTLEDLINNIVELNISLNFIKKFNLNNIEPLEKQKQWPFVKEAILKQNQELISDFNSRWKRYQKKIKDLYEQTNIWPCYIGTFFIKININEKAIYAPLLLKEVEIEESVNDFYIYSKNSSVIINEKIVFFLEQYKKISLPLINDDLDDISLSQASLEMEKYLKSVIWNETQIDNIIQKFNKLKSEEVKNEKCFLSSGICLLVGNPIGSSLRKAVLELNKYNKLPDPLITLGNQNLRDYSDSLYVQKIINQEPILRICQTDFSQEKAIIQSLGNSTIIIGPPGTGKSQTIANIITNILNQNKSAIFVAQKKVALQVVLERLKQLRYFVFELVEDLSSFKVSEKSYFYSNLQKYINLISNHDEFESFRSNIKEFENTNKLKNKKINPLVSDALKNYWDSKDIEVYQNEIDNFCNIQKNIDLCTNSNIVKSFYSDKDKYTNFSLEVFDPFKKIIYFLKNNPFFIKDHFLHIDIENQIKLFLTFINENINVFSNINWNQIVNFLELVNFFEQESFLFFKQYQDFIDLSNWNYIDFLKNKWLIKVIESFDLTELKKGFLNLKSLLIKIIDFNYLDKLDEILNFNYNENKKSKFLNLIDKEFKKVLGFKIYSDNAKELWNIGIKLKKIMEKYSFSEELIKSLASRELLNKYEKIIEFIIFIVQQKITINNFNLLIANKKDLSIFAEYFDFFNKFNILYLLNESIFNFLKSIEHILDKWIENYDFYLFLLKNNIYHVIQHINTINDLNKFEEIVDIYKKHHNNFIPKINSFITDEQIVLKTLIEQSQKIYEEFNQLEKQEFRKLKGRVERASSRPHALMSDFKRLFKKMFKIIVATPETLSTYIDFLNEEYDYVIFDEASQMFLEKAVPFLAIGKTIIIAGDDQQMQPSNWFGLRVSEEEEPEQEDENIDSLLTYAINSGVSKQTLELNYRSKFANLTSFSAKHFYNSELKVADENNGLVGFNSIEVINVNGVWENNSNDKEARKMVEILKENIDKYEKIILLTLNIQQMNWLNYILSSEEPQIYNKILDDNSQIIVKNLENIQGDEADLVIISISYDKNTRLAGTYVCRPTGRNALNVAITRAKQKMIIIKSIYAREINSTNDNVILFKEWINFIDLSLEYQKSYSIQKQTIDKQYLNQETHLDNEVIEWLSNQKFSKNIKTSLNYPIGSYKIHIAILDKKNRFLFGLEIDKFKNNLNFKQKYQDEIRRNFIESKGYKVIWIPEMLWKTNKEKILEEINLYFEENIKNNTYEFNFNKQINNSNKTNNINSYSKIDSSFLSFKNTSDKEREYPDINNSLLYVESNLEKEVIEWLSKQKFSSKINIESQYMVHKYRIDIALLEKTTNKFLLGIEVDGFNFHSTPDKKYKDEARQNFLESKGYPIMRIPEMSWKKDDKNKILKEIDLYLNIKEVEL